MRCNQVECASRKEDWPADCQAARLLHGAVAHCCTFGKYTTECVAVGSITHINLQGAKVLGVPTKTRLESRFCNKEV